MSKANTASCSAPIAFRPGSVDLAVERILVRVRPTRPGAVVIDGLTVSYRQGIRSATQQVGRKIIVRVNP